MDIFTRLMVVLLIAWSGNAHASVLNFDLARLPVPNFRPCDETYLEYDASANIHVVLFGNSDYADDKIEDLPSVREDLKVLKRAFAAVGGMHGSFQDAKGRCPAVLDLPNGAVPNRMHIVEFLDANGQPDGSFANVDRFYAMLENVIEGTGKGYDYLVPEPDGKLERVSLKGDATRFKEIAFKGGDMLVLYYSGHGFMNWGDTFFVPAGLKAYDLAKADNELASRAVSIDLMMRWLSRYKADRRPSVLHFLIDACRKPRNNQTDFYGAYDWSFRPEKNAPGTRDFLAEGAPDLIFLSANHLPDFGFEVAGLAAAGVNQVAGAPLPQDGEQNPSYFTAALARHLLRISGDNFPASLDPVKLSDGVKLELREVPALQASVSSLFAEQFTDFEYHVAGAKNNDRVLAWRRFLSGPSPNSTTSGILMGKSLKWSPYWRSHQKWRADHMVDGVSGFGDDGPLALTSLNVATFGADITGGGFTVGLNPEYRYPVEQVRPSELQPVTVPTLVEQVAAGTATFDQAQQVIRSAKAREDLARLSLPGALIPSLDKGQVSLRARLADGSTLPLPSYPAGSYLRLPRGDFRSSGTAIGSLFNSTTIKLTSSPDKFVVVSPDGENSLRDRLRKTPLPEGRLIDDVVDITVTLQVTAKPESRWELYGELKLDDSFFNGSELLEKELSEKLAPVTFTGGRTRRKKYTRINIIVPFQKLDLVELDKRVNRLSPTEVATRLRAIEVEKFLARLDFVNANSTIIVHDENRDSIALQLYGDKPRQTN